MKADRIYFAIFILLALLGMGWGWIWADESQDGQEVEERRDFEKTEPDYNDMEDTDYGFDEDEVEEDEEFDDYNQIYYDDDGEEDFVNEEL